MSYHEHGPVDQNLNDNVRKSFLSTPGGFALFVFLAVAGVFLWAEHRLHNLGALPLLLPLLICIGMHFFIHRGRGGHGGESGGRDER